MGADESGTPAYSVCLSHHITSHHITSHHRPLKLRTPPPAGLWPECAESSGTRRAAFCKLASQSSRPAQTACEPEIVWPAHEAVDDLLTFACPEPCRTEPRGQANHWIQGHAHPGAIRRAQLKRRTSGHFYNSCTRSYAPKLARTSQQSTSHGLVAGSH